LPGARHLDLTGVDAPVVDAASKEALHKRTGAAAVDMESHVAAEVAATRKLPFAACRVIIDPAQRTLPPAALVGMNPDGSTNLSGVLRSLAQHPAQLPQLIRTALDALIARTALLRGRRTLGEFFGLLDFRQL